MINYIYILIYMYIFQWKRCSWRTHSGCTVQRFCAHHQQSKTNEPIVPSIELNSYLTWRNGDAGEVLCFAAQSIMRIAVPRWPMANHERRRPSVVRLLTRERGLENGKVWKYNSTMFVYLGNRPTAMQMGSGRWERENGADPDRINFITY